MTDDRVREIAPSDDLIAFAIKDSLGERCASFDPDCYTCRAWQQYDRAIASLPAPAGVPVGWKLVPVEPTPDMICAGYGGHYRLETTLGRTKALADYQNLLSASPPPPQSDEIETLRARVKEMRDVAEQWRARAESAERKLSELTQR